MGRKIEEWLPAWLVKGEVGAWVQVGTQLYFPSSLGNALVEGKAATGVMTWALECKERRTLKTRGGTPPRCPP